MPRRISAAYLERKLRSIAGVAGSDTLQNLEDVTQGLVVLESDRPEWRLPGGEMMVAGFQNVPAGGAGLLSRIALINPVGSGVLGIVEQIIGINAGLIGWGYCVTAELGNYTDANFEYTRDIRSHRGPNPPAPNKTGGLQLRRRNNAAPIGGEDVIGLTTGTLVGQVRMDYVLEPGTGFQIMPIDGLLAQQLNAAVSAGILWRVRPLEGKFELR